MSVCVHRFVCFSMQMIMLEGAKATTETVDALRSGASAMKAIQKATYDAFSIPSYWVLSFFFKVSLSLHHGDR